MGAGQLGAGKLEGVCVLVVSAPIWCSVDAVTGKNSAGFRYSCCHVKSSFNRWF